MPPKRVQTVRQLIYWPYAELIARAAGFEGRNRLGILASEGRVARSDMAFCVATSGRICS